MSRLGKYMLIITGILIISALGVFLYHANNVQTPFSFNDLLREHFKEKEIESIFIQKFMSAERKDYSDTHFTDKKDIEFFMQSLPEIQVRSDSSSHGFPEYPTYEIVIRGKNEKLLLAFIISSKDILMHDYEKKDNYSYKITNEFRLDKLEFLDNKLRAEISLLSLDGLTQPPPIMTDWKSRFLGSLHMQKEPNSYKK